MSIASGHSLQHFQKLNQGLGAQMPQGSAEMYGQTAGSSNSANMAALLGRRSSITVPNQAQLNIAEQQRKNSVYQSLISKDNPDTMNAINKINN